MVGRSGFARLCGQPSGLYIPPMATKRLGRKGTGASDFIRKQPPDMKAREVVEAGKKAGLKFSAQLVYNVRGSKKSKAAAGRASTEARFRRLVVELGVTRANELVSDVEKGVERLISGG